MLDLFLWFVWNFLLTGEIIVILLLLKINFHVQTDRRLLLDCLFPRYAFKTFAFKMFSLKMFPSVALFIGCNTISIGKSNRLDPTYSFLFHNATKIQSFKFDYLSLKALEIFVRLLLPCSLFAPHCDQNFVTTYQAVVGLMVWALLFES